LTSEKSLIVIIFEYKTKTSCSDGDSAYPLKTFLIKPFALNTALTNQQKVFNCNLSKARIVVENVFGRLKARWCTLMKCNEMNISNVSHVVKACCVLHSICEIFGDKIPDGWMNE